MRTLSNTVISLIASIPLMVSTVLAETTIGFETPVDGQSVSGRIQVSGWAVDPVGIDKVEFYIDGQDNGFDVPYGSNRADIGLAFPNISGAENSGFGATYSTRRLSNGPHVFRVEVENNNSDKTSVTHTVVVSNEPGPAFPPPNIDLSLASARVVNGIVFLNNVLIGGQIFNNLDLIFDPKSRQFSFAAFANDLDGDGFRDDDSDHDGFSDGDKDEDGFIDDDDGTVRPGIPLALAEVKGTVISVNGNTIIVSSTDPEHGGAVGNVTIDISNAVIDDSLGGQIVVGDIIEAEGSWDGFVLTAVFIEDDDG